MTPLNLLKIILFLVEQEESADAANQLQKEFEVFLALSALMLTFTQQFGQPPAVTQTAIDSLLDKYDFLLKQDIKYKGLHHKYRISKANGTPIDPLAKYFILRYGKGDPHAIAALEAYANSCKKDLPKLSADLEAEIEFYKR